MTTKSRRSLFAVAVLCALAPASVHAQGAALSGTLTAVWGDPQPGSTEPARLLWNLADDDGDVVQVDIAPDLLARLGGVRALDRRRVNARGTLRGALIDVPVLEANAIEVSANIVTPPQLGSRPYAVVLCKFKNAVSEPRPPSDFATLMGNAYPNIGHYYDEVSAGQLNLGGTQVFGWFILPQPKSYYFDGSSITNSLTRLANDCTAAADASVNFASFSGIITQYNENLDAAGAGSAWGGSRYMLLDGSLRSWPFVWMPLWATQSSRYGVYAHEIGHSLGLPHSSGPYSAVYDSNWDVMSNSYLRYDSGLGGWLPGHTIAWHKELLGWIPSSRRVTVSGPLPQSLVIEQSQNHASGSGPLLALVPIPNSTDFYTIEARRLLGYDAGLPAAAVVIHRVPSPGGVACTLNQCARVVDPDNNGNPNDAAAMWLPGETFDDGKGIRIAVTGATANGWNVTITPGNLLTVAAAGSGAGSVRTTAGTGPPIQCDIAGESASGSCNVAYYGNPTITLSATPAVNAAFTGWSGACAGTGPCVVAMDRVQTVTATFTDATPATCTVSTNAEPSAAGSVTGGGAAQCGSARTVAAEAAAGYDFVQWMENGAVVSSQASYTFTPNADRTIVAHFAQQTHRVAILAQGSGSGVITSSPTGIQCTVAGDVVSGSCSAAFVHDAPLTLTVTPAAGSVFVGWQECSGVRVSCAASVTQSFTAVARLLGRPAGLTALRAAEATLGRTTLTAAELEYLDAIGNRNGRFDTGDLLALMAQQ